MDKTHILIVEDEGLIAKDLQGMLRRLGYHVPITVGTGDLAIQTALQNSPDLILMDINLRGKMDGVQAAEAITSVQDIPIVFLTANSDETNFQRAKLTDPFGFLIKPFEQRSLQAGIEMALYKHRSEKRTREREEWLSTTLQSIGDGLLTTDAEGRVTFLNAVAAGLLGCSAEDSLGKPYAEIFTLLDESSHLPAEDEIAAALTSGVSRPSANHSLLLSRTKEEVPIQHSIAPIRYDDARIGGCVVVFNDVSRQRKLETDLRQAQKMDAIGKLAGSIAHDFNNAITAVMGYSSLMLASLPANNPLRDDAEQILRASEHSARLTRQLLAFSRKEILHPVTLNLATAVGEMRNLLRRLIRENIALVVSTPEALWEVTMDPGHCEQLVFNMAINARDAMPNGGKLCIETGNVRVTGAEAAALRSGWEGEFVALRLTDTGCGMPPEVVNRIFEPFFTTKGPDRGTGLGLSTCEEIVRQAKGFIDVSSEPGLGTTFTIYLPRAAAAAAKLEEKCLEAAVGPCEGETILIVEDEEAVRMLTARVLEELGYTVLEAENGIQALEVLTGRQQTVDLVITDMVMPDMSGRELFDNLQKTYRGIKVLCMSGYTDDDILRDAVFSADITFLQKPFTPDNLARKVREVLEHTHAGVPG